MKRLIFYDLDGTLVDTLEDITQAANHMLARLNAPPKPPEAIRPLIGRGISRLVAECLQTQDPKRIKQGIAVYKAYYSEHLLDNSRLYPGVLETLDYFKPRIQVVLTNKPEDYSRRLLTGLGIGGCFADVIGGDSRFPKKPDPASMRAVMEKHKIKPDEALFIGDSPIDIQTGRSAGVFTATLTHGLARLEELLPANPDILLHSFKELMDAARQKGW